MHNLFLPLSIILLEIVFVVLNNNLFKHGISLNARFCSVTAIVVHFYSKWHLFRNALFKVVSVEMSKGHTVINTPCIFSK